MQYYQWLAILAVIPWLGINIFVLFLSVMCSFGFINYRVIDPKYALYSNIIVKIIMSSFFLMFIPPLISVFMFTYSAFYHASWKALLPAIYWFASWWGLLTIFLVSRSILDYLPERKETEK